MGKIWDEVHLGWDWIASTSPQLLPQGIADCIAVISNKEEKERREEGRKR